MASRPILTKFTILAIALMGLIQLQIAGSIRPPPPDSRSTRDFKSPGSDELRTVPLVGLQLANESNTDDPGTESPISTQTDHVADLTHEPAVSSDSPPRVSWKLHAQILPNKYPPPPGGNPTHGWLLFVEQLLAWHTDRYRTNYW
jgi:hypothetical protein